MSGKVTRVSMIKQLLQLYRQGFSNRAIARELGMDKETVNTYERKIKANGFDIEELLQLLLSLWSLSLSKCRNIGQPCIGRHIFCGFCRLYR